MYYSKKKKNFPLFSQKFRIQFFNKSVDMITSVGSTSTSSWVLYLQPCTKFTGKLSRPNGPPTQTCDRAQSKSGQSVLQCRWNQYWVSKFSKINGYTSFFYNGKDFCCSHPSSETISLRLKKYQKASFFFKLQDIRAHNFRKIQVHEDSYQVWERGPGC